MRHVLTTDGLTLAVHETGPRDAPVVVCAHGWPDSHVLWDGVVAELADRFRVVTYDARGAGDSHAPTSRGGYRMDQLVADLAAVIEVVSPDAPVHLLAHDWGSSTAWELVCDPARAARVASYTSISGPALSHAAAWLRRAPAHPLAVLRQARASWYMYLFHVPVVPERLIRAGLLRTVLEKLSQADHLRSDDDAVNGLGIYRDNLLRGLLVSRPRRTTVPSQVLAPAEDTAILREMQAGAPAPWADRLTIRDIPGTHWAPAEHPREVAAAVSEFIASV